MSDEEFASTQSRRLQKRNPHTTGISAGLDTMLTPTLITSTHLQQRGVQSLERHAFMFLTGTLRRGGLPSAPVVSRQCSNTGNNL